MAQWFAYLLLDLFPPSLIPSIPPKFSEETLVDVVEINQRR